MLTRTYCDEAGDYVVPYMFRRGIYSSDLTFQIKISCFQRVSPRCMVEGGGGGAFLLHREDGLSYEGSII